MDLEILRVAPPQGVVAKDVPPLLFVHGAFTGAWCWVENFMPWFAMEGFTCLAVSLRGHGASGGRERLHGFGIDDFVEDVASAVEEAGAPPVLVGHSMGGFVCMRYAEARPAAGLILMASVPPLGLAGPGLAMAGADPLLAFEVGGVQAGVPSMMSLEGFRRALFSEHYPEELTARHGSQMGPESTRAVTEMHGLVRPRSARIAKTLPVAVIGGAEDQLIRPAFVRSTGRAFGVTAEILPRLAHALMLDTDWVRAAKRVADHALRMAA